jgi:hypothetical protein
MTTNSHLRKGHRGSITTSVLAWWSLTLVSMFAIAHTGGELLDRQRLQTAADAIALAWVAQGPDAGQLVAQTYDAVVTKYERTGDRVRVWVTRGDHKASATAQYTQ